MSLFLSHKGRSSEDFKGLILEDFKDQHIGELFIIEGLKGIFKDNGELFIGVIQSFIVDDFKDYFMKDFKIVS